MFWWIKHTTKTAFKKQVPNLLIFLWFKFSNSLQTKTHSSNKMELYFWGTQEKTPKYFGFSRGCRLSSLQKAKKYSSYFFWNYIFLLAQIHQKRRQKIKKYRSKIFGNIFFEGAHLKKNKAKNIVPIFLELYYFRVRFTKKNDKKIVPTCLELSLKLFEG